MISVTNCTAVMISSDELNCSYDIQWRTELQWWYPVTNRTAVMISSDELHCSYDIQWRTALQWWYPVTNCTAVMISSDKPHCSYGIQWRTDCSDDIQWRNALQWSYPLTNRTAVMISTDELVWLKLWISAFNNKTIYLRPIITKRSWLVGWFIRCVVCTAVNAKLNMTNTCSTQRT